VIRRRDSAPRSPGVPSDPEPNRLVVDLPELGSLVTSRFFDQHASVSPIRLRSYPWVESPPGHVVDAAAAATRHPRMVPTLGMPELRAKLSDEVSDAPAVDPDSVVISAGAMAGIQAAWFSLLTPGQTCLVPAPNYYVEGSIRLAGARVAFVHAVSALGTDWDAVRAAMTDDTRALYISNPNNPTGTLLELDDFAALRRLAQEYPRVWLIVDESYEALTHGAPHQSILRETDLLGRTIVVRSFSKSYAVSWLRLGWLVVPRRVVPAFERVIEWSSLYGSYLNQNIGLAILGGQREWLRSAFGIFEHGRVQLRDALRRVSECSVELPMAGPFLFPRVAGSAVGPSLRLAGLPVVDGHNFGVSDEYFRIPFGGSPTVLDAATKAIASVAATRSIRGE
jgi:aspartate/methionine/tyrosine aminotransferase